MSKPAPDSETIKGYARAAYQGTQHYYEFVQAHVIPVLQSQLNRSEYEESVVGAYYRSHLLMRSLVKLDDFDDFQAVRSIARSLFELLLDMKLLQLDPTLIARFSSYSTIERMRSAIRVADFVAKHPSPDRAKRYRHQINLAGDTAEIKKCETILLKVYGITTAIGTERAAKFPKTWSKMDVRTQAAKTSVEDEEKYVAVYPIDSWFVHGGLVGIAGISQDGLVNAYGRGQLLAQKSCHGSTFIIGKTFKLFDAQDNLWKRLKELESLSGRLFNNFMSQRESA